MLIDSAILTAVDHKFSVKLNDSTRILL